MSAQTVTIASLGARGDGVADVEDGPLHVPFTLPGETVAIAREGKRGTLMALKQAVDQRIEPACRHFGPDGVGGTCGGCTLQHLERDAYETWKRDLVVSALAARGIEADIAPLHSCATGARRRVVLTARQTANGVLLGFNQMSTHHIVAISECPVADPAIVSQLAAIRKIAASFGGGKPFRLSVLATLSGLDIAAEGAPKLSAGARRTAIATALAEPAVARLSADGEVLIEARRPQLDFGGVTVAPPPGGFAQASANAEAHMAGLVSSHLKGAKRVADLFSGSGTFALRLARQSAVHAVESDAAALAALDRGWRESQGLKAIKTEKRDLFRRPMMAKDLKAFDGIVFDPPRAGAEAQSRELASSSVKRVAAVSCNPVTLARDLEILIEGGYRIEAVYPVDQFLWSPHVEAVALLSKT